MAYWIQKTSSGQETSKYRSFMCDRRADIQKLPRMEIEGKQQDNDTVSDNPCIYGSDCFCLEDSSVWVLSKDDNEWHEV